MATLHGLLLEAEARGFDDALLCRVYRASFTDYYKGLGLHDAYELGWKRGREKRLDKR